MTVSCNKIFSDSTGDSSDSKMPFRAKNRPKTLRFSLARCYFPQMCVSLAASLLPMPINKVFPVFAITAITKISKWLVCNKLLRKL